MGVCNLTILNFETLKKPPGHPNGVNWTLVFGARDVHVL